jgi:MFS transporter, ACS family, D-galactonate transporter
VAERVETTTPPAASPGSGGWQPSHLWNRQLSSYPENGRRYLYLGITVLATIVLYYELYVQGAVATQIIGDLHMSLKYFVYVSVVGNAVGALASLAAGLADRWGRANLVTYGLAVTGVLVLFGLPHVHSKAAYLVLFALLGIVEGIVLVATPALIRDFSPQLGRASAMGFWTLGPVLGSLAVTEVSSSTLHADGGNWRWQFYYCGIAGLVVFAIALFVLRELSPALRDQLMVSLRDRALVEARAKGIDPEAALQNSWKQMLRLDVVGSAFAISVMLLFYYAAVGFFVIYFATTFGYSLPRANGLANWYWIANAITLVVTGVLSDIIRVRKPFMLVGGIIGAVGVALFALKATQPHTGYYTFAWIILLIAVGGGMAYCAWMASFTETVEHHNPAATATGLAVWGGLLRVIVTAILIVLTFVVTATNTIVDGDKGAKVQELAAKYHNELATAALIDPATQATLATKPTDLAAQVKAVTEVGGGAFTAADVVKASTLSKQYAAQLQVLQVVDKQTLTTLAANPTDAAAGAKAVTEVVTALKITPAEAITRLRSAATIPAADVAFLETTGAQVQAAGAKLTALAEVPKADLAYLQANGPAVQAAAAKAPHQWQHFWWICFAGQILFLPFIFLMAGRWSSRKAREDARLHDEAVQREMAALNA